MKAPALILRGTVAQVLAELRRRANQADACALAGLSTLLLIASTTR